MQREYRTLKQPVKLEKREDGQQRIEGYAAVFYRDGDPGTEYVIFDDVVERVMATAFQEYFASRDRDCRALYNHDPSCLLGREGNGTLTLSADAMGLRYSINPPDTQIGRDMLVSLARGDVTGSSFSFRVTSVTWKEEGKTLVREINSVGPNLFDVGPVTYPAYSGTTAGLRAKVDDLEVLRREADEWRKANPKRLPLSVQRRRQQLLEAE